jgi:hypothetical protein
MHTRMLTRLAIVSVVLTFGFTAAPLHAQAPPPPPDLKPSSILPDRPDAHVTTVDSAPDVALGPAFQSLAAGIAFRPPAGMKALKRPISGEVVIEYVEESPTSPRRWSLRLTRAILEHPAPLVTEKDDQGKVRIDPDGAAREGMLDRAAAQLKVDMGNAEILRQDVTNIADSSVGMVAARYQAPEGARLTQRAIIQASERMYLTLDLTGPAPKTGEVDKDPAVVSAVDTFKKMLDTVQLLDQTPVMRDRDERLYRTRALFVNLTEPRLRNAIVPEQWLRITKDGKDIGYTYVIEEVAQGLPRRGEVGNALAAQGEGPGGGIRIGVRTRVLPDAGVQDDRETWMWVSMDRKHEVWSTVGLINEKGVKQIIRETGGSDSEIQRVLDPNMKRGQILGNGRVDEKQPPLREQEIYTLMVTQVNRNGGKPKTMQLPPFYLPKALGHLMPRILPRFEPKTYLFADYVQDIGEVAYRYVDVEPEKQVQLDGRTVRAIPIKDRIGLEGPATIHYISPEGKYLGSALPDSNLTILPTDRATLENLWKDANLTRPAEVEAEKPGAKE